MFIREFLVFGGCFALFVFYLLGERLFLSRRTRIIPQIICVTGTRGKSSVTRLIAFSLKEAGLSVLTRTTGSKPVIIYPDGGEREIVRRGPPSILEGKHILKLGRMLKVDAVIIELMSIHPECSYVESVQMFKPHILVITNVRLDHLDQMGWSKEEIASCFASSISPSSAVFVPKEEFYRVFQAKAGRVNAKIIQVTEDSYEKDLESRETMPFFEFEENLRLALAVTDFLGIDRTDTLQGMIKIQPDFGDLKVWTADLGSPLHCWRLVSGFAANDPESTQKILSRLRERRLFDGKKVIGLLNLRKDRGDRTIQWMRALKQEMFPEFQKLFFIGDHAYALKRKLKSLPNTSLDVLKSKRPQKIMEEVLSSEKGDSVLVGMGNIGGIGVELVNYWDTIGESYDF